MPDNILRGIIRIEAPNVAQTTNQVNQAIGKTEQSLKKLTPASNQATGSLINLGRVVQDAPFGFIGIANNLNPLFEGFGRLRRESGSLGGAFKALGKELTGAGGISFAISLVSSGLILFGDKLFGAGKAAKEASNSAKELKDSIEGIYQSTAKEAAQVTSLVALLKSETETRERKLSAIKELQSIQPKVFDNLRIEGNTVSGLDAAYKNYIDNLRTVIAVKIQQAQLEQLITKQLQLQGATLTASQKSFADAVKAFQQDQISKARGQGAGGAALIQSILGKREEREKELKKLQDDIDAAFKNIVELSKGVEVKDLNLKPDKINLEKPKDREPLRISFPLETVLDPEKVSISVTQEAINKIQAALQRGLPNIKAPILPDLNDFSKLQQEFIKTGQAIAQFVLPAVDGVIEAISKGENAFRAFGQAIVTIFKQVISKLVQTAILAAIISAISGGAAASAKGGLSFINAFRGLLGGFRATGGPVNRGRDYIVGEQGPEIFRAPADGTIIPNNKISGISGMMSPGGEYIFKIRGQDLVAVSAAVGRAQLRLV